MAISGFSYLGVFGIFFCCFISQGVRIEMVLLIYEMHFIYCILMFLATPPKNSCCVEKGGP